MSTEPTIYRKIPGTGGGFVEYSSLFFGPDHLLQVTSTGFSEGYRRFYFRDIKAITARKSAFGKIVNAVTGGLTLLFLLIGLSAGGTAAAAGWAVPAGCCGLLLLANFLRGPTCVCKIHTAVQSRRLGSLSRLRRAGKLIERIQPHIAAAQGALPVEEIVRRVEQLRQGGFYQEEPGPAVTPNPPDAPETFR